MHPFKNFFYHLSAYIRPNFTPYLVGSELQELSFTFVTFFIERIYYLVIAPTLSNKGGKIFVVVGVAVDTVLQGSFGIRMTLTEKILLQSDNALWEISFFIVCIYF